MSDVTLCWDNVTLYKVQEKRRGLCKKTIIRNKLLDNVSGHSKAGNLCAIMGPSGSGKTTLLAALSQRCTGDMRGSVTVSSREVDKKRMVQMSGFVPQQDLTIASLTVYEHLQFMAKLKMDRRVRNEDISQIIEILSKELNLLHCWKTRLSNLSGGESKRVSLAVQMLPDPPLLFCDEPTTGLDSFSAAQVVNVLRMYAGKGKIVIASIHQPASGIFEMFDTVCFLVTGGKQAFFGRVDDAKEHFSELGYVCPPDYNTAEYYLAQLTTNADRLSQRFENSRAHKSLHKEIESMNSSSRKLTAAYGIDDKMFAKRGASVWTQLKWLTWRSAVDMFRNLQKLLIRTGIYVFISLLISMVYTRITLDQEGIQNVQGRNYSVITETVFTHAYAVMHTFPAEIPVFLREISNGLYKPAPFYFSKLVVLLPKAIVETIVFCTLIYLFSGTSTDINLFWFTFPVVFCAIASTAYGCCISAMFENTNTASLLAVPFDFLSYTFSGLILQLNSLPWHLAWMKYTSRFYYGLEAMTILQWSSIKSIPCPKNNLPCIADGETVISNYGYHSDNLLLDIGGLMSMFFILNVVGYACFARRSKKSATY